MNKTASLTPAQLNIIQDKGTERPGSGKFNQPASLGTYLCRQCGLALFRADSQFTAGCGWPSFDAEIEGTVARHPDADGQRTEIVCQRCGAHLGHEFLGEGFTKHNRRHCVNSVSLDFVKATDVSDTEEIIVAGGCFWGVEYYLQQRPGVLLTEVGYIGGNVSEPCYEQICQGNTGHYEAVRVVFSPNKTTLLDVLKGFFEIHDPTQQDGQGPDIGHQYQSAIFYYATEQKETANQLIQQLTNKGLQVATKLLPACPFWPAEDYHQAYYQVKGQQPYCHRPVKRFD